MRPVRLAPNQPERFYRGGAALARFRRVTVAGERYPEDWVASTTTVHGASTAGLSTLGDGRLLRDAVAADPEGFLGPGHVRSFGADPAVLVKLLDAGERLPVHAHPDRAFAGERLGERYGKSEAWLVADVAGDPRLHVGFAEDVDEAQLRDWVERQDAEAMLAAMHELAVAPGDCIFVPAGTPHAIGEGVLLVEVQEPSDLGVLLEWERFDLGGAEGAHLGLGFDTALRSVRRSAVAPDELASWRLRSDEAPELRPGARDVVPPAAGPFFRAQWLRPARSVELEQSYSVLVVLSGSGTLATEGGELPVSAGDTVLVPYAAGGGELDGDVEAICCLPPRPHATDGAGSPS